MLSSLIIPGDYQTMNMTFYGFVFRLKNRSSQIDIPNKSDDSALKALRRHKSLPPKERRKTGQINYHLPRGEIKY